MASRKRQEASRRLAQQSLLGVLRIVYPEPLVELRDGPAEPVVTSSSQAEVPLPRSRARQTAIREARRRVKALAPLAETPPVVAFDFDAWANRWRLRALRDVAPYLRSYWQNRPKAGARFAAIPRVVPLTPRRRIAVEINSDRDTKAAFLARAEAFYEQQLKALPIVPAHRRRELRQHAEWYVRKHVQGWTVNRIAVDEATAGTDTIRKGIATFTRLLDGK